MDIEKYYGKRKYQEKAEKMHFDNMQKSFTDEQKKEMLRDMVKYIEMTDFDLYHDFMDDLSENRGEWFNFLCFDRKAQNYILKYIKVRVQKKNTNHILSEETNLEINENCYSKSILVERNCHSCEFNAGSVCAGYGTRTDNGEKTYGMSIDQAIEMFPNGCEDYGISLWDYIKLEENYWEG